MPHLDDVFASVFTSGLWLSIKDWRRRPDLNRGSRFCRQGRNVYLVDSSCLLVGPTPSFSLVFGRYCSQIVPKFTLRLTLSASMGDGGSPP